jgi:hypothetical protein
VVECLCTDWASINHWRQRVADPFDPKSDTNTLRLHGALMVSVSCYILKVFETSSFCTLPHRCSRDKAHCQGRPSSKLTRIPAQHDIQCMSKVHWQICSLFVTSSSHKPRSYGVRGCYANRWGCMFICSRACGDDFERSITATLRQYQLPTLMMR